MGKEDTRPHTASGELLLVEHHHKVVCPQPRSGKALDYGGPQRLMYVPTILDQS